MDKSEIFKQIEQRAKAHLKNISTLTADKYQILYTQGNDKFIHLTGVNRTHLQMFQDLEECATFQQVQNILTLFNHWLKFDCKLIHYYNGNRLIKINKERAQLIFCNMIERQILIINKSNSEVLN